MTKTCQCGGPHPRVRTPEEAFAAGRAHAQARGDRLTQTQIVRLAALVRPHLDAAAKSA